MADPGDTLRSPSRAPLESYGNFDLIQSFRLSDPSIDVYSWRSRRSGLRVVHLNHDAPLVHGSFVVATEIFDNSGCPHTLEHLVFSGSKKYPQAGKGFLVELANRCFAAGINAYTADDQTVYTVSAAGEEGFLQLLPVYINHILYPSLTKASFITEVHHIDGKGQDAGVVYSEMQGRENTSSDLLGNRLKQLAYPPESAYRSEVAGLLKNLRSLTIEQIHDYHQVYYVPHNLTLIVCGKFASGTASVLDVLQNEIEPSIVAHGQSKGAKPDGWKRPFMETASANRGPFQATIKEVVEFPERDDQPGEMWIIYLGPSTTAFLEADALDMLGRYLTASAVAPLTKEYVEIESPLCTEIVFFQRQRATYMELGIWIQGIPVEHLETFDEKLKISLQHITTEGINMDRMAMVIDHYERQLHSFLESQVQAFSESEVLNDVLYNAEDNSELAPSMEHYKMFEELRTWTSKHWTDLIHKYYLEPHCIVLCAKPSSEKAEQIDKQEKARIAAQQEHLGPEGLEHCQCILDEAVEEHAKKVPAEILKSFPVPDVNKLSWIPVQTIQEKPGKPPSFPTNNHGLAQCFEMDKEPLPFYIQYDHIESNFITVHAYLSLAKIPGHLYPYLNVYQAALFSLPLLRSTGEQLDYEQVVNRLNSETVFHQVCFGTVGNLFAETMHISIRVDSSLYETAITWLKDIIHGTIFDKERLQVAIAGILQSLPSQIREGDTVCDAVCAQLLYDESSMNHMGKVTAQSKHIPRLAQRLRESPDEFIKDLQELRSYLTDPTGSRVSVTGNMLALKEPQSAWRRHFKADSSACDMGPLRWAADALSAIGKNPVKKAVIVALSALESTFATHVAKSIVGWDHPDYPVMNVATELLNGTEGYFGKEIRGTGLAYTAWCLHDCEAGLISFTLHRSSNCMAAIKAAHSIVRELIDGSAALSEIVLDAAKSACVYNTVYKVSTPVYAANTSFINQGLKGVSPNFNIETLNNIQKVTREDVIAALRKYYLPLFDPSSSIAVVTTAPGKVDDLMEGYKSTGYEVEQRIVHETEEEGHGTMME